MRTIATLQTPDTGSIEFNDIDIIEDKISLRKTLGYLPQSFGVYPNMSAEKLLNYFAKLKGISNKEERKKLIDELLDITNLTDVKKICFWIFWRNETKIWNCTITIKQPTINHS